MGQIDEIRSECWERVIHSFGTGAILEQRAIRLRRRLRVIAFASIAFPLSVGAALLAYDANSKLVWLATAIATLGGFAQALLSAWALSFRWEDEFADSREGMSAMNLLYEKYKLLAASPPLTVQESQSRFEVLLLEDAMLAKSIDRLGITDEEKRMGMRAALRQQRKQCAGCGVVPETMAASTCGVCGSFCVPKW